MKQLEERCQQRLADRRGAAALRTLSSHGAELVDFCSNDYLSLSAGASSTQRSGSTGSRLVSGNSKRIERLETAFADFHGFESGLLFNSGYDANLGLLASIAGRTDVIIIDELAHASLIDGARLSSARRQRFGHNGLVDLETKLQTATKGRPDGAAMVVVEATYSMDGDQAPLVAVADLCDAFGASLVVDEAHSVGVEGDHGEGLVSKFGLQNRVLATVYTFGKALGCHGALVAGPSWLRNYLINFCRPFIYSTAPSPASVATIASQHERMVEADEQRRHLSELINQFRAGVATLLDEVAAAKSRNDSPDQAVHLLTSNTPIQAIVAPGNIRVLALEEKLSTAGFATKAIRSPTVAVGSERIRICLHAHNTFAEVDAFVEAFGAGLLGVDRER